MSQKQLVRRICDVCKKVLEFEVGQNGPTGDPAVIREVQNWTTLAREYPLGDEQQGFTLVPVMKHVCTDKCYVAALGAGVLNLPRPQGKPRFQPVKPFDPQDLPQTDS